MTDLRYTLLRRFLWLWCTAFSMSQFALPIVTRIFSPAEEVTPAFESKAPLVYSQQVNGHTRIDELNISLKLFKMHRSKLLKYLSTNIVHIEI